MHLMDLEGWANGEREIERWRKWMVSFHSLVRRTKCISLSMCWRIFLSKRENISSIINDWICNSIKTNVTRQTTLISIQVALFCLPPFPSLAIDSTGSVAFYNVCVKFLCITRPTYMSTRFGAHERGELSWFNWRIQCMYVYKWNANTE